MFVFSFSTQTSAELTYSWNDVYSLQICCCLEDVFRKLFRSESNKRKVNLCVGNWAEKQMARGSIAQLGGETGRDTHTTLYCKWYSHVNHQDRLAPVSVPNKVQQVARVRCGDVQGVHHMKIGLKSLINVPQLPDLMAFLPPSIGPAHLDGLQHLPDSS